MPRVRQPGVEVVVPRGRERGRGEEGVGEEREERAACCRRMRLAHHAPSGEAPVMVTPVGWVVRV